MQNLGFFFPIFCVLSSNSKQKLLKHSQKGFQSIFVFLLLKERTKPPKNDNWNFRLWVLLSKNGRLVTQICFQKHGLLNPPPPIFIVFFWGSLFGQVVKKREIWTPTKKREKFDWWLKSSFSWYFCFFFFLVVVFVFFGGRVRWGGPKGHLTWP